MCIRFYETDFISAFVSPSWMLQNPPDPRLHWEVLSVWICNCYFFLICGLWMIRWKKWKNQKLLSSYFRKYTVMGGKKGFLLNFSTCSYCFELAVMDWINLHAFFSGFLKKICQLCHNVSFEFCLLKFFIF